MTYSPSFLLQLLGCDLWSADACQRLSPQLLQMTDWSLWDLPLPPLASKILLSLKSTHGLCASCCALHPLGLREAVLSAARWPCSRALWHTCVLPISLFLWPQSRHLSHRVLCPHASDNQSWWRQCGSAQLREQVGRSASPQNQTGLSMSGVGTGFHGQMRVWILSTDCSFLVLEPQV